MDEHELENLSKQDLLKLVRRLQAGAQTRGGVEREAVDIRFGVYQGAPPATEAEALRIYLRVLAQRCCDIPLSGLDRSADGGRGLGLERIYVDLDTRAEVSEKLLLQALQSGQPLSGEASSLDRPSDLRPLAALEAVALYRRLVLLGDPGSGKTTLVRRLTLALAGSVWDGLERWPEPERERLPVLVGLRDFARWLGAQTAEPGPALLWAYIGHDLRRRNLGFIEEHELLPRALHDNHLQMFLDGLDEVSPELRQPVLDTVAAFAAHHPQAWLLVTCRVASYTRPQWRLPEALFPELRLAPFNHSKVQRFVGAWYEALAKRWEQPRGRTHALAVRLKEALARPELVRLASNPLLLTVMALVHSHDKVLPGHRALLYERTVDILMWRWESGKSGRSEESDLLGLLREAGSNALDLLRVLRRLAFEAHARIAGADNPEQVAGIGDVLLSRALAELHPDNNLIWARSLVECMRARSGLLVEKEPGLFSFPHRSFEEYLAAVRLALDRNFANLAVRLADAGDLWREVILLAVGYRVYGLGELEFSFDLANALCPRAEPTRDEGWRKVRLAGEVLLEMGINRVRQLNERGDQLFDRVARQLTSLLEQGRLDPLERAHAAEVLGSLGDPRFDPKFFFLPRRYRGEAEPTGGFVKLSAGIFWMGGDETDLLARDEREFGNPNPLKIPYDYWMGRYPVTVAQFSAFIADGGYREERWWRTEAGRTWLKSRHVAAPGDWESQRLHPSRPVAVVTWFEAMAYCVWLNERLRALARSPLPAGYRVRLPTEAEWEKAARGGRRAGFPWGSHPWNRQRANVRESDIGHCTPVGMYPKGATAAGLHDLAGNVWEWTLSGYADYPYFPDCKDLDSYVLRGGSWFDDAGRTRCATRISAEPDLRSANLGFRTVVSVEQAAF